jgi:copper chaperone CopZ
MKNRSVRSIRPVLLAALPLLACGNAASAASAEDPPSPTASSEETAERTVILGIGGMTCASCSATVKVALKKLDGVLDVTVSFEEKRATVNYDAGRVTPAKMVEAVEAAGYEATVEPTQ